MGGQGDGIVHQNSVKTSLPSVMCLRLNLSICAGRARFSRDVVTCLSTLAMAPFLGDFAHKTNPKRCGNVNFV